jgi:ketosteroid isomerase-like protein
MDSFKELDHGKILSCLTDDVVWDMPGFFHHEGKEAFDKEIENDAFTGKPDIKVTRMIEEGNIVVAEGSVKASLKDGQPFDAMFCDVFEFRGEKISRLISYVMNQNMS